MIEIGKWRGIVSKASESIDPNMRQTSIGIEQIIRSVSSEFPRQPALCWQYNRLCSYASICSSQAAEDLHRFTTSRSAGGHDELHQESDSALDQ
jgi:hypothetical protein